MRYAATQSDVDPGPVRGQRGGSVASAIGRADSGRRRAMRRRGGFAIVFFVMIVFAFMAMAAVVIDLANDSLMELLEAYFMMQDPLLAPILAR